MATHTPDYDEHDQRTRKISYPQLSYRLSTQLSLHKSEKIMDINVEDNERIEFVITLTDNDTPKSRRTKYLTINQLEKYLMEYLHLLVGEKIVECSSVEEEYLRITIEQTGEA